MEETKELPVGIQIKEELAKQGRSQKWLGLQIGVAYQTLTLKLNGMRSIKIEELRKIEQVLGVKF